MPPKQKYSDPKLRDEVKEDIKQSDKGGEPGQWSARKAQMMAKEYKKRGGDYNTPKSAKDESQKNLENWGEEDWQTKDGSGEAKNEDGSRKRYLPKKAWEQMSDKEKEETDEKKQEESKKGKQFVGNTGKAKNARKNVSEGNDNEDEQAEDKESNEKSKTKNNRKSLRTPGSRNKTTSNGQGQNQKKEASSNRSRSNKKSNEDEEAGDNESDGSANSSQQENKSPGRGQKRGHAAKDEGTKDTPNASISKKQKTSGDTIGSNHDAADAPAKQGSNKRLPKKGQKKVHWKAMPGWVEGEVVEIVDKDKEVDGKKVKASKQEPKVVLKSKSSGKICVHKADNVYFD